MAELVLTERLAPQLAAGRLAILRATIARRLGLPANAAAVTDGACAALLDQAGGDAHHLNMLLATLFFLAETDDLDRVDLPLAERAIALQPVPAEPEKVIPPPRRHLPTLVTGGAASFAFGVIACLVAQALFNPPPPIPASALLVAKAPAPPPSLAASPGAKAAPVAPSQPAAPRITPPPDAPPPAPQAASLESFPARAARPTLVLRFFMASPGAAPRARFIQQRLEEAGFTVTAVPDFWPRPPRDTSLWYFHPQDEEIAQRAVHDALLVDRPPLLAFRQARLRGRPPPGTLELDVP